MSMPKTYSAHIFELGCMDQRVYLQDEADKTFEELKDEIQNLRRSLIVARHEVARVRGEKSLNKHRAKFKGRK